MGRTLKRVPLDFNWPRGMVWKGYLNPFHAQECKPCGGTGSSPKAKLFADQWHGYAPFDPVAHGAVPLSRDSPEILARARRNVTGASAEAREVVRLYEHWSGQWAHQLNQADVDALVAADRLWDFTRRPLTPEQRAATHPNGWTKEPNGYRPTAEEVNAWSIAGMGHDAINQMVCVRARCEREGVPTHCDFCQGEGRVWQSEEVRAQHEAWQPIEPPGGDGYQLWETTTEGSPDSPVFPTLDELCAWCEANATTFGAQRASASAWRWMLAEDRVEHVERAGSTVMVFT